MRADSARCCAAPPQRLNDDSLTAGAGADRGLSPQNSDSLMAPKLASECQPRWFSQADARGPACKPRGHQPARCAEKAHGLRRMQAPAPPDAVRQTLPASGAAGPKAGRRARTTAAACRAWSWRATTAQARLTRRASRSPGTRACAPRTSLPSHPARPSVATHNWHQAGWRPWECARQRGRARLGAHCAATAQRGVGAPGDPARRRRSRRLAGPALSPRCTHTGRVVSAGRQARKGQGGSEPAPRTGTETCSARWILTRWRCQRRPPLARACPAPRRRVHTPLTLLVRSLGVCRGRGPHS